MNYSNNILKIPSRIPGAKVAQYMYRRGVKNYNLCGPFCVAYIMQDEAGMDDIDQFLDYWELNNSWYKKVFTNNLGRKTGVYDLTRFIQSYDGVPDPIPFNKIPLKAGAIGEMLSTHQAIIGVHIDYRGFPVGNGIPHWIVMDGIEIFDDDYSLVKVYNPFNNSERPISWQELKISTGPYKNGLWVER